MTEPTNTSRPILTETSRWTRTRDLAQRLSREPLLRKLLSGAAIGGGVKVAGMALAFVFFVVLARVMTPEQYGIFAAGFSLATILGFAATIGQHTAVLRFWPAMDEAHGPAVAAHAVRRGARLVAMGVLGVLALGAVMAIAGPEIEAFGGERWIFLAIGAMAAAFALSEYATGALRAKGSLLWALAPRDIAWRLVVIAAALVIGAMAGGAALWLVAGLLLAIVAAQAVTLFVDDMRYRSVHASLPAQAFADMRHAQWGLWGNAIVEPVSQHAATVIVGVLLGPAAAGAFFAE